MLDFRDYLRDGLLAINNVYMVNQVIKKSTRTECILVYSMMKVHGIGVLKEGSEAMSLEYYIQRYVILFSYTTVYMIHARILYLPKSKP